MQIVYPFHKQMERIYSLQTNLLKNIVDGFQADTYTNNSYQI